MEALGKGEKLMQGAQPNAGHFEAEHRRLVGTIKRFFGLDDDAPPSAGA